MPRHAARHEDDNHELEIAIEERRDAPGVWTVEAIDNAAEGEIYQALFVGPLAQERAREYAAFKYRR